MKRKPINPWACHAVPEKTGKTCGHMNVRGGVMSAQGLVCCAKCGETKLASDARRDGRVNKKG